MARKPAPKSESAPPPSDGSKLSKYQKFQPQRVHRRDLKNAPYNPRVMTELAEQELREVLKTHGLVETLVWNRKTGHLVGGHQRIAQLDHLQGSDDYELDVSAIDVPEKKERKLNVILNNPRIQGEYDGDKLLEMFDDPEVGLTPEDVYLSEFDLEPIVSDEDLERLFPKDEPETAEDTAEALSKLGGPRMAGSGAPVRDPEALAEVRGIRAKMRDRIENDPLKADTSTFTLVIVCGSQEEMIDLGSRLGARDGLVDCRMLYAKLGEEPPKFEEA